MFSKIGLAVSLLRSKTYVLLTDDKAVVSIPLVDMTKFDNILLLTAQAAALDEFQSRLADLALEHEQHVELLTNRKDSKLFGKGKTEVNKGKK